MEKTNVFEFPPLPDTAQRVDMAVMFRLEKTSVSCTLIGLGEADENAEQMISMLEDLVASLRAKPKIYY